MSKVIDEKIVSMQFDNRKFEQGVATTMSTLEKFKQKLNFTGSVKGLEELDNATKRIDMSTLSNGIETVRAKFSALQVMGITALTNITNSAINAGKKIVSALTIDPIKTGFQEYETQINAVQTILANTQSKGSTLQDVNAALDELNTYADKTIYNFTEMTRNIGTFTAAGVDLDTSVNAIQGIANLAAVSGSTSQQASTAMYQLSQALASGTVKLMDWNSVVNAGMGGQVFQDALMETARLHGISIDRMVKKEGSFRETLKHEWLTADILTETLNKFTLSAEEGSKEWEKLKKSLTSKGYTEKQAIEILKLGNTATDAATKVKTFTQLFDVLKEAAQSGWSQSWRIIVGDFEEAKSLLTPLSDTLTGFINGMSKWRNSILEFALDLSKPWDVLEKKLGSAGLGKIVDFTDKLEYFQKVVSDVWQGDYGNGAYRRDVLEKAGYNYQVVQDLVDKGSEYKLTVEDIEASHKKFGLTMDKSSKSTGEVADELGKLTDEQLKNAGLTEEEISLYRAMEKEADRLGITVGDLAKKMSETDGRSLLIDSFTTLGKVVVDVGKIAKEAFTEIFNPPGVGELAVKLYGVLESLKSFVEGLRLTDKETGKLTERGENIKRVMKGVFSIFDMLRKIVVSVGKAFLKLANSEGVSSFGKFILETFAEIGDFFTNMNSAFDTDGLMGILSTFADGISTIFGGATEGLKGFGKIFSAVGQWIVKVAKAIWGPIKTVFTWITENVSLGDIFAGLVGGGVFSMVTKLGGLFDKVKDAIDVLLGRKDGEEKKSLKDNFVEVLDTVKGSLESFTQGIKVWSLVGIAAAVAILAGALRTISELDAIDIGKSLIAIAAMLYMLTKAFGSMTLSLKAFESKGIVKSAFALILVAKAVDILADVMAKLSELSFPDILKGLFGVGIALLELAAAAKIIDRVKISVSTGVAIVLLAKACEILGDALKKFGEMSWYEIEHGLAAMGGALLELVVAMRIMKKAGGLKSVFTSVGLLILIKGLSDLADALKKFGEMQWDEIERGLAAMGGALLELVAAMRIMKKAGGLKSIFGSAALLIVIQGLDDLSEALKKFGEMQWDEIGRGLAAMGGALGELTIALTVTGKIAGFSSIFAAGAIYATIQGLDDLATALEKFGAMQWDEIGRGLAGMGGALLEVGGISGALGYFTGLSGLFGSGTILATIQGLDTLAEGFKKFAYMSWEDIAQGLVGMGGALLEVGGISGALGYFTNIAGVIGAGSIWIAVQGLGDLADAFKKFGEMSWDEIGRGLAAMGGALGEVALGSFINSLSGLGALSIAEIAEPLGVLADSVVKWGGVSVPEGLGTQLTRLAAGIFSFTLDGAGASALAELAAPLGTLAESVQKWAGVTVPEGIGTQLDTIADGIGAFTWKGLSASVIAEIATPLGDLADSVSKWSIITVPEGIGDGLASIATGVSGFTWLFTAGWSLSTITGPLGDLADSITKWSNVTIPEGIGDGLASIATGLAGFTWLFTAGWSLSTITGPLGELVDDILKWEDISVPTTLKDDLSNLAEGIKSFSWAFMGGWSIDTITGPLGDLADTVSKWKGVTIPEGIGDGLTSLAEGVKSFKGIKDISNGVDGLERIASNAMELSGIGFATIRVGMTNLAAGLTNLAKVDFEKLESLSAVTSTVKKLVKAMKQASSEFETVGTSLMTAFSNGISSSTSIPITSARTVLLAVQTSITSNASMFTASAKILMVAFTKGITGHRVQVITAFSTVLTSSVEKVRGYYSNLYSAGGYVVTGFAAGITAKTFKAEAAAAAMAKAAKLAAEKALGIASPSKELYKDGVFSVRGFVNAFYDHQSEAYDAGYDMAASAQSGLNRAVDRINSLVGDALDVQPTIMPLVDLSAVRASTNDILNMLNLDPSVGILPSVHSISAIMNRRNQNGANDDVVDAIGALRKDLGNVNSTSYNINGITYNADSDVGEAIETLIRAIRVEGRV